MKNIFALLFIFPVLLFSCASGNDQKTKDDSTAAVTPQESFPTTLKTDSGTIQLVNLNGTQDEKATLVDANGKVKAKGMFLNNQPAGAWVKYDENGNIVSAVHYENGKVSRQLDKNDFDMRLYENKKLGVKFMVPKTWKELPSPNADLVVTFEKEVTDTAVHLKPAFNVVHAKMAKGETLSTLAKEQIDLYRENFGRVDIVDTSNLVLDSCKAFRCFGMYPTQNNQVGFLNMIIVTETDTWMFSCAAQNKKDEEFLNYQGVFQQIAESFQRLK